MTDEELKDIIANHLPLIHDAVDGIVMRLIGRVMDHVVAAERTRILAAMEPVTDLLADMHDDGEDCRFQGGEGCLACMMFDLLGRVIKEVEEER